MANVEKMKKEFDALLKKYEGASMVREWQNAASGVQLGFNLDARKKEIEGFKKRFEAAMNEN